MAAPGFMSCVCLERRRRSREEDEDQNWRILTEKEDHRTCFLKCVCNDQLNKETKAELITASEREIEEGEMEDHEKNGMLRSSM